MKWKSLVHFPLKGGSGYLATPQVDFIEAKSYLGAFGASILEFHRC